MRIINFAILLIFLISLFPVYAQEEIETTDTEIIGDEEVEQTLEEAIPVEEVGVTPDKATYGLKLAIERLRLALTFNRAKKAEFRLRLAENRVKEAALMARLNKLEALERAKNEHARLIEEVKLDVETIEDSEQALEIQEELETKIEENQDKIEEIELRILIRARGLTEEQQAKLLALLEEFRQNNQEIKIKVVNKKDVIKTRLRAKGLTEEEIKLRIKERRERLEVNLEERVQHQIDQATKMLELANRLIEKAQTEKNVTIRQITLDLKAKAESKLNESNAALTDSKFRLAIELARQSKKLSALTIASIRGIKEEKLDEELEELEEEEDELEELEEELEEEGEDEIEVKIRGNLAKVEVDVNGIESEFILETTNQEEIIAEIASRTGLSVEEIESIIKFEVKERKEIRERLKERRGKESEELEEESDEGDEGDDEEGKGD